MKIFAQGVLLLSAVLLLLYPLWGMLSPETYAVELKDHYAFADGASFEQIRKSASMLWLSNGLLAAALVALVLFIQQPSNRRWAYVSGILLVLYPFARTVVEVWSGLNLTAHVGGAEMAIELSSEKAFYMVFGFSVMGLGSAFFQTSSQAALPKG